MWGSACGGSGVYPPRKKYQVAKVSLGCLQHSLPLFSLRALIRVSFLQSPVLFLSHMSARRARSLHRAGAIPLPPRTADITPRPHQQATWAHSLQGSLRVWAPSLGCLETTDPRKEARQVKSTCLPGAPGRDFCDLASSRFKSAASSRAIFGGQITPFCSNSPLAPCSSLSLCELIPPKLGALTKKTGVVNGGSGGGEQEAGGLRGSRCDQPWEGLRAAVDSPHFQAPFFWAMLHVGMQHVGS